MTNKQFKEELKKEIELALHRLDANERFNGALAYADGVLTKNNYANLIGLLRFATHHPELSGEQIEYFIKGKDSFKFLNKFISVLPDAVEELRFHGISSCVMSYKSEFKDKNY